MDDVRTIEILTRMLKSGTLSAEEQGALREAIGILAWSKLIPKRMESIKKNREKRAETEHPAGGVLGAK